MKRILLVLLALSMLLCIMPCSVFADYYVDEEGEGHLVPDFVVPEEIERDMKEIFAAQQECDVELVRMSGVYGIYGSCYVVMMHIFGGDVGDFIWINVAGYDFLVETKHTYLVYREGELVTLEEAYNLGWLTENEIYDLWHYIEYEDMSYPLDDEERAPVTGDAVIPVAFAMLCALGGMLAMRRKRIVK